MTKRNSTTGGKRCTFLGCERPLSGHGFCGSHLAQLRRGIELRPIRQSKAERGCNFAGCGKPHSRYGYCDGHSRQLAKGHPLRPLGWRNTGKTKDASGYIRIYAPEHPNANGLGYVPEHRLVMSEMLGRPLAKGEQVHHKDGDRSNNDPSNLELRNGNHGNGARVEDKLKAARELLLIYGTDEEKRAIRKG